MSENRITFKRMEIENFKSVGPTTHFDFQRHLGLNYVFGVNKDVSDNSNGAGKSVLFTDAITFALFGKTYKNTSNKHIPNRLMHNKGVNTSVRLWFSVNEDEYEVESYMNHKLNTHVSCRISKNGVDETKGTAPKTRAYIENEVLKCSYQLFKSSIVISTNETMNFFSMPKAKKLEFIEGIFKLTVFSTMTRLIRDDANNTAKEATSLQREVKSVRENLEDYRVKESTFGESKASLVRATEEKITRKKTQIKGFRMSIAEAGDEDDRAKLARLPDVREQERKLHEGTLKVTSILKESENAIRYAESLVSKHSNVLESVCGDCKDKLEDVLCINEAQEKKRAAEKSRDENASILTKFKARHATVKAELDELTEAETDINSRLRATEHARGAIAHLEKDVQDLEVQVASERAKESPFADLIQKSVSQLDDKSARIAEFAKKKKLLDILELVTSEDGAKRFIIRDIIEVLNGLIKRYLEELGSEYACVFDDNFGETFLTTTGPCSYENFSKGERQRINLAVMLAFKDMQCVSLKTNLAVFDEVLDDGLDTLGFRAFIDIIRRQCKERQQTAYLISHREATADEEFDNVIEIEKRGSHSTIVRDEQGGVTAQSSSST